MKFLGTALGILGSIPLTVLAAQDGAPPPSPHRFSANIGLVSNYVSRGTTQTDNRPALQVGLDYRHASGLYAGTWASNVDYRLPEPDYEIDLYLGYQGALIENLEYDFNFVYYLYPGVSDWDYADVVTTLKYAGLQFKLAYTCYGPNQGGLYDRGDIYYGGGYHYAGLPFGLGLALRLGYYDFHNDRIPGLPSADYLHYGAGLTQEVGEFGTLSLNWDQNNGNHESIKDFDRGPIFWVGLLKEF